MKSGRTLWDELVHEYTLGAEQARELEMRWRALQGKVDEERHRAVLGKLHLQAEEAASLRTIPRQLREPRPRVKVWRPTGASLVLPDAPP